MKYRILAAISLAVLATGCTRKAEGQTVAVVNGEEITVPDLNFALELAKVPDTADKNTARSQVLQQLVDRPPAGRDAKPGKADAHGDRHEVHAEHRVIAFAERAQEAVAMDNDIQEADGDAYGSRGP